jgi:hypothetical protein
LIDLLHETEKNKIMEGVYKINSEIKTWDHEHYEPKNYAITILKALELMEERKQRQERLEDTKGVLFDEKTYNEEMQKLRDICTDFNVD